ncbi:hypothetical protein BDR03DRAFT_1012020 [Suillus americanus]|nr:hypothetical protein BDR03DRAFT_1012020 [Suillus americanus]
MSPHPDSVSSRHAVVCTKEEEMALYEDKIETGSTISQADGEAKETTEAELACLMKDWNSPVYAFFDPTPQIVEMDGCRAHNFKCQARNCKAKVR